MEIIPITPVKRPDYPFQVVNVDIIGLIGASSCKGRYILMHMDQHTHWPDVACLTTLSAKSTCEVLLKIFQQMGIPEVIASDQGPSFISAMTKEMIVHLPGYLHQANLPVTD